MAEWRYIVQRLATKEFLEYDLPFQPQGLTRDRSGSGSLKGTISPEIALRAPDGKPLLDEWSTALYVERDGSIEWGGIVVHSKPSSDKATWTIEASGFSSVLYGLVYNTVHEFPMNVDPLTVVRHLWDYAQSHPRNAHLDMVVTGDTDSGEELGDPPLPAYREVYVDGRWQNKDSVPSGDIDARTSAPLYSKITKTSTSMKLKRLERFDELSLPFKVNVGTEVIEVHSRNGTTLGGLVRAVDDSTLSGHYAGTAVTYKGTPERIVLAVPAKPYTLSVFESHDCGRKLDELAATTPFDWVEKHRWSGDDIVHEFEVRAPRVGSVRDDLVFVQGDNIIKVVEVDRDGDEYANEIIGLGKGQGEDAIRSVVDSDDIDAPSDGRLWRTRLSPDKGETSTASLNKRIKRELATRLGIEQIIESITVVEHPNAPIGSWEVGDDIFIQATVPWLGDIAMYCRVESWTLDSDTQATIRLTSFSSSAHARLARELLEISNRVAPLERSTQAVSGSETFDFSSPGSSLKPLPKYSYKAPSLSDFDPAEVDPLAAMEASDLALDRLDALDSLIAGGGLGGGGGGGNFAVVEAGEDGTYPPRPSSAAPPAFRVLWIGPDPGRAEDGTGLALKGDLWAAA